MAVKDILAMVQNAFKDNHFTVRYAIIVVASKLKVTYVTGFNPLSYDAQYVCGE
jgi:hypothetical protein